MQNDISKFKNIFKTSLAVLVFLIIVLGQMGFVLAVAGAPCANDGDCLGGKCCCCPVGGCNADHKGICGNANCTNIVCPFSSHLSLEVLINNVVNWVFNIGIVLCPLMIVIGAFLFMTSAGEPKRTQLGKDILKWSIIGLAVILFAKGLSGIIRFIVVG